MVHFSSFSFITYGFSDKYPPEADRLPDSGIPGSKFAYNSPGLIAVYHALLRLLAPRHPSYALISLTTTRSFTIQLSKNWDKLKYVRGEYRIRTGDLPRARRTLSQLS